MVLSKCAICGSKKSRFIKNGSGILSNLDIRTHLSKNSIIGGCFVLKCKKYKNIKLMSSYGLKCGENTKSIVLQVSRAINGGVIILSRCVVCSDKKYKFIKKKEVNGLLNNLSIKKLLSKIPILKDVLF